MPSCTPTIATVQRSARTLGERLAARFTPTVDTTPGHERGDDAMQRWRRRLDREGSVRFERRLRWDGLDESSARAALHAEPAPAPVPEWALLLDEACAAAEHALDEGDVAIDAAVPIPFEEVLLPFVQVARARLRAASRSLDVVLSADAQRSLDRTLLLELSAIADQALTVDFSVALAVRGRGLDFGTPGRTAYRGFVRALRAERLAPLVASYPVLARLLALRATFWVSSSAELVSRIAADADAVAVLFDAGELGPVVALESGRGDTHREGRTVVTLRFAGGRTVMYKPRSMQIDLAVYHLMQWLGDQGLEPDQRMLKVLDRGEYGWVEFVRPSPVESEEELRAYYERAGVLLCLSYVLGAADLHAENVIAAGAYPVPVDLEMMMCAPLESGGGDAAVAGSRAQSPVNVLGNLLLPFWNVGTDGAVIFRGGGLGLETESLRASQWRWTRVNTDQMRRERVSETLQEPTNVPRFAGRLVPPAERIEDLIGGFERCHALLEARREALLAPSGPLARFRRRPVRVIVRDTRVYGTALRGALHPLYLRDGFDRSLQLEVLRVSVLGADQRVPHWLAFDAEQRDLEDLDYPVFWAYTDGTTLHDSRGAEAGTYCTVSPFDQALARLARLDANDREHEISLIRFIYAYATGPVATVRPSRDATPSEREQSGVAAAIAEARAIAAALEALIIRDRDGSAQWVGVDREQRSAALGVRRLPDRLYDGRAGVALFLSALDAVAATGHVALAADSLRPLRARLRDPAARAALPATIGIGAGLGVGGLVYAFAQIGRLSGDPAWLDDARNAARSLTDESIAADQVLEVLGGAAGAALALLSLHEITGDGWVLDRAIACGRHLLASAREEPATRCRVWRFGTGQYGTGFAHGAGGIASALLRLATVTGDARFADAAAEGFRFESVVPDPHLLVTPHLASAVEKASVDSPWRQTWCNGPIGVALGRAIHGAGDSTECGPLARDREDASSPDHACCGTMGRVDLLLATGRTDQARDLVAAMIERARARKSYSISRDVPEARYTPAFFQGLSGIGYQMLRSTDPQRLRSVLAFQ